MLREEDPADLIAKMAFLRVYFLLQTIAYNCHVAGLQGTVSYQYQSGKTN
jgi:hypothetical protein